MDGRPFVALILAVVAGCVAPTSTSSSEGGDAPAAARAGAPASPGSGPMIAGLKLHDGRISITSSADGPRVTLTNLDGDVTAENLTLDELRAQAPEAYRLITSSRAFIDASLDRSGVGDRGPRGEIDASGLDFAGEPRGRR